MSKFSVITKPTTDLVMKLYRGINGKDMKPEERRFPAISASSRHQEAHRWAETADHPESPNINSPVSEDNPHPLEAVPHVWELEAQPRRPVTFDDRFVTLDQLNSKFDLTPIEEAALYVRYAKADNENPEYDINYLLKDPDFVDMLRQREIDIVISPERLPGVNPYASDTAMSTAESYHILDDSIITNRRRVGKYMVDELGFYSPARRVVEGADQDKGDAGYWRKILTEGVGEYRPKNGIKPKKDADDIGLFDWLESGKGPIRRADILNYIDSTRIDISQSAYRGDTGYGANEFNWYETEIDEGDWMLDQVNFRHDNIVEEVSGGDEYWTEHFHKWMSDTNRHMSEERALEIGAEETQIDDTTFYFEGQDLHDFAEELAQQEYYDNPVYRAEEEYSGYEIVGNDDMGYMLYYPNGERVENMEWRRFEQAIEGAQLHAIENGAQMRGGRDIEDGVNPDYFPSWTLSDQARNPGSEPVNLVLTWDNDTLQFTDVHFDEDNYFAHARGEHRYVDGAWSFHIDEIQSDWHHKGADSGYIDPDGKRVFIGQNKDGEWLLRDAQGKVVKDEDIYARPEGVSDYYTAPRGSGVESKEELIEYVNRASRGSLSNDGALIVPDDVEIVEVRKIQSRPVASAPFGSNWHEVMFKRAIYDALINAPRGTGSELVNRITWTTGETQARRYGKYAFHKEVHIEKSAVDANTYWVAARTHANQFDDGEYAKQSPRALTIDEIKADWGPAIAKLAETVEGSEMFTDIESGISKGMSDMYDKKIPQFAKKWLKRYGVEIKKTRIEAKDFDVIGPDSQRYAEGKWVVRSATPEYVDERVFDNEQQVRNYMEAAGNIEVWYFDITPEMRDDILENGIPLTMSDDQDDERMVA